MAWDEAVTVLSGQEVPYVIYGEVKAHFSPVGIANLTPCVVEINGWGRLMVAFSHATVAVGPFRNGKSQPRGWLICRASSYRVPVGLVGPVP